MRHVTSLALAVSAVALCGCVNSKFDSLTSLTTGCGTSTTSVNCVGPTVIPATVPTTPSGTPIVNTGNTVTAPTGDTTLALENSKVISSVGNPAVSNLKINPLTLTPAATLLSNVTTTVTGAPMTIAQVAALNAPGSTPAQRIQYQAIISKLTADQLIQFNTNTASNGLWPVAKNMTYSDSGSCTNENNLPSLPLPAPTVGAIPTVCSSGTGGTGLGANYKLYRYYSPGSYDEELQVWAWNQSYATQYRDVTASGTDPQHQAWSFGGNYTTAANMPTGGVANYTGQWGATSKTWNFKDTGSIAQTVSYNNNWRVTGSSALTADFGNNQLTGSLQPLFWQGVNKDGNLESIDVANCRIAGPGCNLLNFNPVFMDTQVILSGTISKSATPTGNTKPNQVSGTASFDPGKSWITSSGTNPMYAGFFGPVTAGKPQEVTGVFAFDAIVTAPNGSVPINNDRRSFISMSGIFNGQ